MKSRNWNVETVESKSVRSKTVDKLFIPRCYGRDEKIDHLRHCIKLASVQHFLTTLNSFCIISTGSTILDLIISTQSDEEGNKWVMHHMVFASVGQSRLLHYLWSVFQLVF
jgi:hypothetical protein